MWLDDLVRRARAAAQHPTGHGPGLTRMTGGMTHHVYRADDDPSVVVKVFLTAQHDEPQREWGALTLLAGTGLAPDPLHFAPDLPAVVVMTHAIGTSLAAAALETRHAQVLGRTHRRLHRLSATSQLAAQHRGLHATQTALLNPRPATSREGSPDLEEAWSHARRFFTGVDLSALTSPDHLRFARGDPNLSNYLWNEDGSGVVLIDWENAGANDPTLDLADMAEHASTRGLSEQFWHELADATGLTPQDLVRVRTGRRLMACFWLVLIHERQRQGKPTTVSLEEQVRRTLAVLNM